MPQPIPPFRGSWLDPSAWAARLAEVGPAQHAIELAAHRRRSVAATVNGHDILPFPGDGHGGRCYRIGAEDYPTLDAAKAAALAMPSNGSRPPL